MQQTAVQIQPFTPAEQEQYALGRECFARGEVDRALEALEPLLERRRGFADLQYMVGVLLDQRGDTKGATERLRDAIRLNPGYAEALLALASVYERAGDFQRSQELTEQAAIATRETEGGLDATTQGKLANLQAAVGDAYAEAGEVRDAIEAYRKALDRCSHFHDIRIRLAIALRDAGLPRKAESELQQVLRENPDLLEAEVQLGLTYYTLGRASDAVEVWRAVLTRDRYRQDAQMYLRMVERDAGQRDPGEDAPGRVEG